MTSSSPPDRASDRPSNRLARESSPYLLQHAHNPVDWHPWGPEAFAEARRREIPLFVSIGYSTCYWCHVMERESFEDERTAALMNERFVCVKVDREQRPDVDELYMAATVTLTGRGGWPMSVFVEPTGLRPYWAGTYFPPEPRHGMPSFASVLTGMSEAWTERRAEVVEQAEKLAGAVREQLSAVPDPVPVGSPQIGAAVETLLKIHDRAEGGFGRAPKFPQPAFPLLLLEARDLVDDRTRSAIDAVLRRTLDRMAVGGLHDQIGGGFHRYSVDEFWTVPHFEKMLYDQAQLVELYALASVAFDDAYYARVARGIAGFVSREMTLPSGGFVSALDAEVDGREGLNYLWTADEVTDAISSALSEDDAAFAANTYGLDGGPNFRDPHHPGDTPRSVLRLADRPDTLPGGPAAGERLERINAALLAARSTRKGPHTDDKALMSWNGLMIRGLAVAGAALDDQAMIEAADRAAKFVMQRMYDAPGGPFRVWREGVAQTFTLLEDHAALATGLLALDRVRGGHAAWAERVLADARARFEHAPGVFFDADDRSDDLFIRPRSTNDGAVPSASSLMLAAMAERDGDAAADAVAALRGLSGSIAANPVGSCHVLRSVIVMLRRGTVAPGDGVFATADEHAPVRSAHAEAFTPVEVFASEQRVRVAPGKPDALELAVRIAEGYHVTAADPGPEGQGLVPLRVGLIPGSGSGVRVYADYPEGEPYGPNGGLRVYRGETVLRVLVERTDDEWLGRPILGVTFQPCTDDACLQPMTVELDVAIDRAE